MNKFLSSLKVAPLKYQLFFSLLPVTGLRTEEALGLKWNSVDLDNNIIRIENAVSYSKRKGKFEHALKTEKSYRCLPIPPALALRFKSYQAMQKEEIKALGDRWIPNNLVFTGEYGGPMGANTARHWLKKFCEREGLRYIPPHSFRHFTATAFISQGVAINEVSENLGHSNVSTTSDIYCDAVNRYNAELKARRDMFETLESKLNL